MRARALALAGRLDAAGPPPGRPGRPGAGPGRGGRAAALAGRRPLRLPRRPRRRAPHRPRARHRPRGPRQRAGHAAQRRRRAARAPPEARAAAGAALLTVGKADVRATVHRRAWLDLVAVTLPDEDGGRASTGSPGCCRRRRRPAACATCRWCAGGWPRSSPAPACPADSHTGKELVRPAGGPSARRAAPGRRRRAAAGGARRAAAAGAPADAAVPAPGPQGRFWSALVYLPRDRYTTEVRPHAAAAARAARRQRHRVHGAGHRVGAGPAALRRPAARWAGAARPAPLDVDVAALQAELAAAARSWTDDLTDALHARHGADAERLLARVADAFPAAYQEDFPAERPSRTSPGWTRWPPGSWPAAGTPPREGGEARLTVYRVGERLLLSDVLPMLQHMGVDVVDERPYEIDRIGAPPAWIYDFGLTVPGGELPAAALAARAVHRRRWRGLARRGRGRRPRRAGAARRAELAAGHASSGPTCSGCARPGLPFGQALRGDDAGRPPRRRRPAGGPVRDALLAAGAPAAARSGRRTLAASLRQSIGEVESLDADRVLTALLAAVLATQRTTYYAVRRRPPRWRSSCTRPRCPTCPSRGRSARCG